MSPLSKLVHYMIIVLLIFSIALVAVLTYFTVAPIKTTTLHAFKILTPEVRRGERLEYFLAYTKIGNFPAKVRYFLIDGLTYELPSSNLKRPLGYNENTYMKDVPFGVYPGNYRLQINIEYKILPWRTEYLEWLSPTFLVK